MCFGQGTRCSHLFLLCCSCVFEQSVFHISLSPPLLLFDRSLSIDFCPSLSLFPAFLVLPLLLLSLPVPLPFPAPLVPVFFMCSSGVSHVFSHVPPSSCVPHVFLMCFSCAPMGFSCVSHVFLMCFSCVSHVFPCVSHVFRMSFVCVFHVLLRP